MLQLQCVHEEAASDGGLQVVRRGDWGAGAGQAAQEEVRLRQQAQKSGENGKIFRVISERAESESRGYIYRDMSEYCSWAKTANKRYETANERCKCPAELHI